VVDRLKVPHQNHWIEVSDGGEEKFDGWITTWKVELRDFLKELCTFQGMTILNIGGGPVPIRFPHSREEILLDNNLDFFDPMFPSKYREGMILLNDDMQSTHIPNNYVDMVYCRKTLEYILEWADVLAQIHRVLKPKGYLILIYHEIQGDGINLNLLNWETVKDVLDSLDFEIVKREEDESSTFIKLLVRKK